MYRETILQALKSITGKEQFSLAMPENPEHGDYATNIALQVAKEQEKSPRTVAEELVARLKTDEHLAKIVEEVAIAGPGFINFFLSKDVLVDNLIQIIAEKEDYGKSTTNKDKTVIVEYSSPNIAKPFTIGHLRSTIIGDAIANILAVVGWNVMRDNHLGDWGTQFGKQIYAIKTWGDANVLAKSTNPVKDLVALYVKFHEEAEKDETLDEKAREWFKKLEDGDPEARDLWQNCVDWSWKEFDRIYALLGVRFSPELDNGRGLGESFFEDKMGDVIQELDTKGFLKEGKEGAKLVYFPADKYPPAMILKKDGATLYHTRDLAADKYRKVQFDPKLIINEVGAEQALYFQQLFEMEKMLGWYTEGQRVHIAHGLIRFKQGKMSTRKGNIIWLEDVLTEAKKRARDLGCEDDKTALQVGIGALKWNDLKRDPRQNVVFDWDDILNMHGNSGPYVQYTYARAQSVLAKAKALQSDVKVDTLGKEELKILRRLSQFRGTIEDAAKLYSPNLLNLYLYELARDFNSFYNKEKILGGESQAFRLQLTASVAQVLKNGLNLLGIETPAKM